MSGVGPIPWTAMDQYADKHAYIGADYDTFVEVMELMDGIYLKFRAAHAKEAKNPRLRRNEGGE